MTITGEMLKANGQTQALRRAGSAWLSHAIGELEDWLTELYVAGRRWITMDEFRASGRCPEPASPNAWGALPRNAVRAGLIQPSLLSEKAKRLAAHARRVRLWSICPDMVDPQPAPAH